MDFSALYRLIAVLEKFKSESLSVSKIHSVIQENQKYFLSELDKKNHPTVNSKNLLSADLNHHGHFLTFNMPSTDETKKQVEKMKAQGLITDSRGSRLRFGFGLYHDQADIAAAVAKI